MMNELTIWRLVTAIICVCIYFGQGFAHEPSLEVNENKFLNSMVDSIIQKHWKSYVEEIYPNHRLLESEYVMNNDWEHTCSHDNLVNEELDLKSNLDSFLNSSETNLDYLRNEYKKNELNSKSKKRSSFESIRFFVNTTILNMKDVGYACYSIGSRVSIGDTTSGTICVTDGQNDCIYTCTSEDISSTRLISLISSQIMPTVIDIFQNLLKIERIQGNLLLDENVWNGYAKSCIKGIPIDSSLIRGHGDGIPNTDMLVYVTNRPSYSSSVVASALACNFDWDLSTSEGIFGRPLAGYVNFNPRKFQKFLTSNFNLFDFQSAVKVGVHEFTHALGFSSFFYNSYIDTKTGLPHFEPTIYFTRSGTSPSGSRFEVGITMISTPKVVATAREHYGCESLHGVELEDYGGRGTAGSHWEMRQVQNEYMSGYVNPLMPISYLTLSLFEDMGWYKVNYNLADYWSWGKDRGCAWATLPCHNSWVGQQGYFCSGVTVPGCTADRQAYGNCHIGTHSGIVNPYYQHFTQANRGGPLSADGCTYNAFSTFCANMSQTPSSGSYESFGSSSLCFEYAKQTNQIPTQPSVSCYPTNCTEYNVLQVKVAGTWYTCPMNGGTVSVPALNNGVVNCPPSSLVCKKLSLQIKPVTTNRFTTNAITTKEAVPITTRGGRGRSSTSLTTSSLTDVTLTTGSITTLGANEYVSTDDDSDEISENFTQTQSDVGLTTLWQSTDIECYNLNDNCPPHSICQYGLCFCEAGYIVKDYECVHNEADDIISSTALDVNSWMMEKIIYLILSILIVI